jgi:hypothetical protein
MNTNIDTTVYNELASNREILKVSQALDKKGFKRLDYNSFRKKVLDVFDIDIDTVNKNDVSLVPEVLPYSPFAVKNARFIDPYGNYIFSKDKDDIKYTWDDPEYINLLYDYNQMLFYNDKAALMRIANSKSVNNEGASIQESFEMLLDTYYYTGNDDITKILLKRISDDRDGIQVFTDIVYGVPPQSTGIPVIHKNVLDKIVEYKPDLLIQSGELLEDLRDDWKSTNIEERKMQLEKEIAILLDATVRGGITGFSEEFYNRCPYFLARFRENKYYELKDLEDYSEHVYSPEGELLTGNTGIINDPDGYVNVRKERDAKSEIICRILQNEKFLYWPASHSNWWSVKTKDGKSGYVHKSRIKQAI